MQHFGLTGEHIAKRALDLLDKKLATSPAVPYEIQSVRCSRCHGSIPITEYAKDFPLPTDELCFDCEHRSLELCTVCRIEWGKVTHNTDYVCLSCRAKPVLR